MSEPVGQCPVSQQRCRMGCGLGTVCRELRAEPRRLPVPGSISDRAQAGLDAGWWVPSNSPRAHPGFNCAGEVRMPRVYDKPCAHPAGTFDGGREAVVMDTVDFLSLCPADSPRIEQHLEALCPSCKGSGDGGGMTYGAGPDDHWVHGPCSTCGGSGELPRCPWDEWKPGRDV